MTTLKRNATTMIKSTTLAAKVKAKLPGRLTGMVAGLSALMLVGVMGPIAANASPWPVAQSVEQERLAAAEKRIGDAEREAARLRRLVADMSAQMATLERQIRQLTGRIEEMEFDRRQMVSDMNGMRDQVATLMLQQAQMAARQTGPTQSVINSATSGLGVTADGAQQAPSLAGGVTPADARLVAPENQGTSTAGTSAAGSGGSGGASGSDALEAGEEALAPIVTLPEGSTAEQFDYAFAFINRNALDEGRIAMEAFIKANPSDPITGNAYYWLGRVHLIQKRTGQAAEQFLKLIEQYPDHNKKPEALLELAAILIAIDSAQEACDALADFRVASNGVSPRLVQKAERLSNQAQCR